ncbi:MAG: methionine synthase [Pseudomonadota bacterium]|nr:methionine synthase [Pseudomonadota bacterium]
MTNIFPLNPRGQLLKDLLKQKILVLDGAMGTSIQNVNLGPQDFGGVELEGCNENLVLTRPDVIKKIHEDFLAAGCDIVETNTFGGTELVLNEYKLGNKFYEINFQAAKLARAACDKFSTKEKPRFVAGSLGPTTKAISVTGGVTFAELIKNFRDQAKALIEGGADYLLLETAQDSRNLKAALIGFDQYFAESKTLVPVAISGTIEPMGTMLAGQSVESFLASFNHRDLLYMGLNCATGPEFMTDHIRTLSELSRFPVACVPNAGLPDTDGVYLETPAMVEGVLSRFLNNGWINLLGGCCGTTPAHIEVMVKIAKSTKPRVPKENKISFLSGIDYLEFASDGRPFLVGERTNVIGSRKFKKLICDEKFDEASEIARAQVKGGAHVIDVCLANPDRDELKDTEKFLSEVIKKIRAPLMIDSTDEKVIAMALTYCQGKAIINSINLEDGEERYEKVVPLARQFGAALVVGTIDDDAQAGMAVTRERKLAVATRSFELLTKKYGVPAQDIYWDPLVFPCATGDANYVGSALETIEGLRLIKQKYPETKSVLGISNVSFGLPEAGREILNSVFLYHCVVAGLDLAIVNSEKLKRYALISDEEKKLADDLLFNKGDDPIAKFAAHFRDKKVEVVNKESRTLEERLAGYILEGSKDGLAQDITLALKTMKPLNVINGPLMAGMDEVGRLFNQNKLIVAEVLQSAEAMKAAVKYLEPYMEKLESSVRGKMILATVKGDVHDIGKNLVEIILANNGFNVINLGIKVPPQDLINAAREHKPDIIGLSGLLVKSAQQMVITVDDFSKAGINIPVLVGGAALTQRFADTKIAPSYSTGFVGYATDAMNGLDLAKKIVDPKLFATYQSETSQRRESSEGEKSRPDIKILSEEVLNTRDPEVPRLETIPEPTDYKRHTITKTPIDQIWQFINPLMLYTRHLGLKASIVRQLEAARNNAQQLRELETKEVRHYGIWRVVEKIKEEYRNKDVLKPKAVYQFFRAQSEGRKIHVFNNSTTDKIEKASSTIFEFERQTKTGRLCLADYVEPLGGKPDNLCLFVVSVGDQLRAEAEELKNRGEYLRSHVLQALALESAEAYAELLHLDLRKTWGIPDPENITMMERFQAKYHGKRYSFGYPACPNLDDQKQLFDLLKPEDIGVELTDGFMMDPEASVSAIVFHHPFAKYFGV